MNRRFWKDRSARVALLLVVLTLVPSVVIPAMAATAPTFTGDYEGFALPDGGSPATAALVLDRADSNKASGAVTLGDGPKIMISGTITDSGRLTMTGDSGRLLLHGRVRTFDGVAVAIETRYQIADVVGASVRGTAVVVRQAETVAADVRGVWGGQASSPAGETVAMTLTVDTMESGALSGSVDLGAAAYDVVGHVGQLGHIVIVGASHEAVLVATGDLIPGRDRHSLSSLRGAVDLFQPDPSSMSPPEPESSVTFELIGKPHPPTFTVDPTFAPYQPPLPPFADGLPRPVARFTDDEGGDAHFVENEVVLRTNDPAELTAFLGRWDGTVVRSSDAGRSFGRPRTYVVRIDASRADVSRLSADVQALEPRARGNHRVSSAAGLGLLAAAAVETRGGLAVGIQWLLEGDSHLVDREAQEAWIGPTPNWDRNAFNWWQLADNSYPGTGTAEAWRLLDIAHRTTRMPMAVIDGGFSTNVTYPENATGASGTPNAMLCSGGNPCPWHGTSVAETAAAPVDDFRGSAGTGGLVADLRMYHMEDGTSTTGVERVYEALGDGARIINISLSYRVPAVASVFDESWDEAAEDSRAAGALLFASAGNQGIDVDAEDCAAVCWEEQWVAPCEDAGTICVGGTGSRSRSRHTASNYGYEWCGSKYCDVDLWAPFIYYVDADPTDESDDLRSIRGTSFSAPYVAGVAALVWAANPALTDDEVESILHHTAIPGADMHVGHIVNAKAAVRHALPANSAPTVVIDEPSDLAAPYGWPVQFRASGYDVDGGCCTFEWKTSSGIMGHGESVSHTFTAPGKHQVTVTATDATGRTDFTYLTYDAYNRAPIPTIEWPTHGAVVYRKVPQTLEGRVSDANELKAPCSYLKWTSDHVLDQRSWGGSFPVEGCSPTVRFNTPGERRLTLTATDVHGAADWEFNDRVTVNVTEAPDGSPPFVAIVSPTDGSAHMRTSDVTLDGASFEDGDAATYRWILVGWGPDGGDVVIAETLDATWTPSDHIGFNCGGREDVMLRLEGTDDDGTSSDTVTIDVQDNPC